MSDAEILYIVYEIINNLPAISNKHFLIRLNHALLIKSILIYCGIKDRHDDVLNNLKQIAEIKESKMMSKYEMQNYFISLGLPDNNINMLINFFSTEFEISKVTNYFQMITKKKTGEASQMAKTALKDLRTIAQTAETFGVTVKIKFYYKFPKKLFNDGFSVRYRDRARSILQRSTIFWNDLSICVRIET